MKKNLLVAALVAIFSLSSVMVMAADSPTAPKYHNITVGATTGGSITTSSNTVEEGQSVTLTATAQTGNAFTEWIITGDYSIVSGSLTSSTLVITPKADLVIAGTFKAVEVPTEEVTTVAPEDPTAAPDVNDDIDDDDEDIDDDEEDYDDNEVDDDEEETAKKDDSATSPQTGLPIAGVLVTLLASGAVAASSKKRM